MNRLNFCDDVLLPLKFIQKSQRDPETIRLDTNWFGLDFEYVDFRLVCFYTLIVT
jgi:hypothetical protein